MERAGLAIEQRATYQEHMDVDAWIRAAGTEAQTAQTILALLTPEGDPAGLHVRRERGRLTLTHQTCILIARHGLGSRYPTGFLHDDPLAVRAILFVLLRVSAGLTLWQMGRTYG